MRLLQGLNMFGIDICETHHTVMHHQALCLCQSHHLMTEASNSQPRPTDHSNTSMPHFVPQPNSQFNKGYEALWQFCHPWMTSLSWYSIAQGGSVWSGFPRRVPAAKEWWRHCRALKISIIELRIVLLWQNDSTYPPL